MEYVSVPGATRPLAPQAVVLLNPATGQPYAPAIVATDSAGTPINPDAWSHTYAYDATGQLTTDTATDGTATWVKTYSYTNSRLTAETRWVKQ